MRLVTCLYIKKSQKYAKKYTIWKFILSNPNKQTILERKCWRIVYAKKTENKIKKEEPTQLQSFYFHS